MAVVTERVREEDAVRLRRSVNDLRSCRDWESLRDYCLRSSTDPTCPTPGSVPHTYVARARNCSVFTQPSRRRAAHQP